MQVLMLHVHRRSLLAALQQQQGMGMMLSRLLTPSRPFA